MTQDDRPRDPWGVPLGEVDDEAATLDPAGAEGGGSDDEVADAEIVDEERGA